MIWPRSVYVHVPFCRKACHYCAFHFSTTRSSQARVLKAMVRELDLRLPDRGSVNRWPMETLYLGGGTPSLLEPEALTYLVNGLFEKFDVSSLQEFTL
jgi:oxygen-independent coproporphyrinogen-3 oxidase